MSKRITTEEYISRCLATHGADKYNYSNTVYKTAKGKVEIFCNTCQKTFYQIAFEHANNGQGCPKCGIVKRNNSQRKTRDEFISEAISVHGDGNFDYSLVEYKSYHEKVLIHCLAHDVDFLQSPANHLAGKGCKQCGNDKVSVRFRDTRESFEEKAIGVFGSRFDYSEVDYKGSAVKVRIRCKEHNKFFYQTPNLHLSGRVGCEKCQSEFVSKALKDTEYFINKSQEAHGVMAFNYSKVEYKGADEKVTLFCNKHKIWFEQTPSLHYNSVGCPECLTEHRINNHPFKITTEEFVSRASEIFNGYYDYSLVDLSGSRENRKVRIICPEHGIFEQDIHSHLSGVRGGCCVGRNKTTGAFIEQVVSKHGDVFDFSETEYKGSKTPVILTCKVCNHRFNANPGSLLQGHSCPSCADYGFNPRKPAKLYIHNIVNCQHSFTGFGITRNLKARTRIHTKNLNREGYLIVESFVSDELDGKFIQQLEKVLKETFPLDVNTSHLVGFKTESTTAPYHEVVAFVQNYINTNKERYAA